MAKIIVLGGGMVGSAMCADLAGDHDVTCADFNIDMGTPPHPGGNTMMVFRCE